MTLIISILNSKIQNSKFREISNFKSQGLGAYTSGPFVPTCGFVGGLNPNLAKGTVIFSAVIIFLGNMATFRNPAPYVAAPLAELVDMTV